MKRPSRLRFHYRDIITGTTHPADRPYETAPTTDNLLLVDRDEDYVREKIGTGQDARNYFDGMRSMPTRLRYPNNSGVWMWRDFILPGFPTEAIISLNEGQTDPFQVPEWFEKELGHNRLFVKMEGVGPSGSFKDRGMTAAVSDALRLQMTYPGLGIQGIACASTGDTSAAAAIYSAYRRDKLKCIVLLPNGNITPSQLFQARAHGARVIAVNHPDTFDGCMRLVQEFSRTHPEYVLVNSKNPMRIAGQETIGLEILQDLQWHVPEWIVLPVGNGGNLTALLITLRRAKAYGLIDRLPRIIAAQTAAADTLVRWQESGGKTYAPGEKINTVASAMNIRDSVSFPRIKMLWEDPAREFDLRFMRVAEEDIRNTWARYMRAGAMICPQSAVALAAIAEARESGIITQRDTVVAMSTANGLKFTESGIAYHDEPHVADDFRNPISVVGGTLEEIEAALQ